MNDATKNTLINFPCYFPIKIIGINSQAFVQEIKTTAGKHFSDFTDQDLVSKESKNSSYLAITVTVFAKNQNMLDSFYNEVTKIPGVKMVL